MSSWSCFNGFERRYGGQDLNGRRLAIYRENGYGDALMVTGLTGWLKTQYPTCTINVYSLPRVGVAWIGNADATFLDVCPTFDAVYNRADYHLFFEGTIENASEPEQLNAYDMFLSMAGVYPKTVPDEFKKPQIFWTAEDEKMDVEWQQLMPKGRTCLFHWNPSGRIRQYPFDLCRKTIELLAEHFEVVVIGNTEGGVEPLNMEGPRIHNWMDRTPSPRSFLPMIKHSSVVVCPDSCVLHMSACFNGVGSTPYVPVVALYAAFSHHSRSKYYHNVTPIEAFGACPSAPCFTNKSDLPKGLCSQAQGWHEGETMCRAMYSISPEKILETVLSVVK